MSPAICFNLDQSRILSSGNGLSQPELVLLSDSSKYRKICKTVLRTFLRMVDGYGL